MPTTMLHTFCDANNFTSNLSQSSPAVSGLTCQATPTGLHVGHAVQVPVDSSLV